MEIFGLVSSIRTITRLIRMMAVKWHAHDGFQDISIYCLSISLFIFFFFHCGMAHCLQVKKIWIGDFI